jgi:plastocyanin
MNRTATAVVLVAAVVGATGCADDSGDATAASESKDRGTVLKLSDTSEPGKWSYDKKKLTAKAGKVTIVFHNDSGLGHQVRVHTGKCCLKPGYKDLGGTRVIGAVDSDKQTTARATLNLKPGTYTYLCAIPGHFQAGQHGTLVVK